MIVTDYRKPDVIGPIIDIINTSFNENWSAIRLQYYGINNNARLWYKEKILWMFTTHKHLATITVEPDETISITTEPALSDIEVNRVINLVGKLEEKLQKECYLSIMSNH